MQDYGLGFWLGRRRHARPDKIALTFCGTSTTYGELATHAEEIADALSTHGVKRGDAVAYLGENSPSFIETLFACAMIGAVFVPINTRLAPREVQHILSDSSARAFVVDDSLIQLARDATRTSSPLIPTTVPQLLEERDTGSARLAEDITLDSPAAIIYTSGTTGQPKGAVLTHGNLTWTAINAIVDYDITSRDVSLMISPLFHVASLGMGALPCILKGATMILEPAFDPGRTLDLIQANGATMLSGVPTTFQMLTDHPSWSTTDLSSLQTLTCGGSAIPSRILDAYEARGLSFTAGYGMTETSPGASSLPAHLTREKQGSVGIPHFFTKLRVTGPDGAPTPPHATGEIELAGPNVFLGYLNCPETTAAGFTDDGWFRSGDLGYLDEDGCLYIADRLKDMIISGGENIYPAEVETLIGNMETITGVAVIGVPDDQWGEVPIAVVTTKDGSPATISDVKAHLAGTIARYKVPKRVITVDALPRTASGKVRKAALRAQFSPSAEASA